MPKNIINEIKLLEWNGQPEIGWWLDNKKITVYYPIKFSRLTELFTESIDKVFLDPNTAFGSLSVNPPLTPEATYTRIDDAERAICIFEIPTTRFTDLLEKTNPKLTHDQYNKWIFKVKQHYQQYVVARDQEFYSYITLYLNKPLSKKYFKGYMIKPETKFVEKRGFRAARHAKKK